MRHEKWAAKCEYQLILYTNSELLGKKVTENTHIWKKIANFCSFGSFILISTCSWNSWFCTVFPVLFEVFSKFCKNSYKRSVRVQLQSRENPCFQLPFPREWSCLSNLVALGNRKRKFFLNIQVTLNGQSPMKSFIKCW